VQPEAAAPVRVNTIAEVFKKRPSTAAELSRTAPAVEKLATCAGTRQRVGTLPAAVWTAPRDHDISRFDAIFAAQRRQMVETPAFTVPSIERLRAQVGDRVRGASSLETAAQRLATGIFEAFDPGVVLARVFVTQPYGKVPAEVRAFVDSLSRSKGIAGLLRDDLPVLSLLGTRGTRPAWNERRHSKGHLGIPLAGARFVQSIPMLARLFQEIGMDLKWFDDTQPGLARRLVGGGFNGLFYVADARATVDSAGRHVITAQDFVTANDVKTVFGVGGAYLGGTMIAVIVFSREAVERPVVERFALLISPFKSATSDLVLSGRVFMGS
jgi:hypothetical protein